MNQSLRDEQRGYSPPLRYSQQHGPAADNPNPLMKCNASVCASSDMSWRYRSNGGLHRLPGPLPPGPGRGPSG